MSGASTCSTTCQPRPFDAVDDAVEHGHVGRAAEMLHEIETHAAHAAGVELVEILVGEAVVDDRDAAIALWVRRNAVEHRRVVGAVAARLHDDRALDAEMRMQRREHFLRRILRRVAPVRRIGKFRRRAEHVAMRVARARRQLESRLATM